MSSESESETEHFFDVKSGDDKSESGSEEAESEEDSEYEGAEQKNQMEKEKSQSKSDKTDAVSKKPIEKKKKKKEQVITIDPSKMWVKKMLEKFKSEKGKTLFVRFPHTFPADLEALEKNVKNLCNRVIKVRLPKYKRSRHCLVDFESIEDRTKGMKELKNAEINGEKLFVSLPKTEDDNFVMELIKRKAQNLAERRARKKAAKAASVENTTVDTGTDYKKPKKANKTFTSSIIVENIPSGSTETEIKDLFPKAINVKVNVTKGAQNTFSATVTFPTPKDATKAKRLKYKMGENNLKLSFAIIKSEKNKKIDQTNGQSVQKASKLKKGKRRLDSTSESPSPKKKAKKNKEGKNAVQTESKEKSKNVEKFKKKKLQKKLNKEIEKKEEKNQNISGIKEPKKKLNREIGKKEETNQNISGIKKLKKKLNKEIEKKEETNQNISDINKFKKKFGKETEKKKDKNQNTSGIKIISNKKMKNIQKNGSNIITKTATNKINKKGKAGKKFLSKKPKVK